MENIYYVQLIFIILRLIHEHTKRMIVLKEKKRWLILIERRLAQIRSGALHGGNIMRLRKFSLPWNRFERVIHG